MDPSTPFAPGDGDNHERNFKLDAPGSPSNNSLRPSSLPRRSLPRVDGLRLPSQQRDPLTTIQNPQQSASRKCSRGDEDESDDLNMWNFPEVPKDPPITPRNRLLKHVSRGLDENYTAKCDRMIGIIATHWPSPSPLPQQHQLPVPVRSRPPPQVPTPLQQQQQQHMRELQVEDSLLYLDDVKREFQDRPEIYNEFLSIMKNFNTQEVDTPEVINRVSRLFRGYNNLILSFNTFLPEGYKISLEDLQRQEAAHREQERQEQQQQQQQAQALATDKTPLSSDGAHERAKKKQQQQQPHALATEKKTPSSTEDNGPKQQDDELSEDHDEDAETRMVQEAERIRLEREAEQAELERDAQQQEEKDGTLPWCTWMKWALLSAVGVGVGVLLLAMNTEWLTTPAMLLLKQDTTPVIQCYHESPTESADDANLAVIPACPNIPHSDWFPCPKNAHCLGGAIEHSVDTKHFILSDNNECVLTDDAQDTIQAMVRQLEEWTVEDICQVNGNPYVMGRLPEKEDWPMFGYTQLVGELERGYDLKLVQAANDDKPLFVTIQEPDGDVLIGLDPSYNVAWPGTCRAKLRFRRVLELIQNSQQAALGAVLAIVIWVPSKYWGVFLELPLLTSFFTVVLLLAGWAFQRRRLKLARERRLQLLRVRIREYVYQSLAADPREPRPILLIRDEILDNPNLTADRDSFKVVWPLVVSDVRKDSRVLEARVMTKGFPLESWKWNEEVVN